MNRKDAETQRRSSRDSVWLCVGVALVATACHAETVTVTARDSECADLPVSVEIPAPPAGKLPVLTGTDRASVVPCQLETVGGKTRLWWIQGSLAAGASLTYTLSFADQPTPDAVELKKADDGVDVSIGGQLFTRYLTLSGHKPVCYPIIGPTGKPVTRNYPMQKVEGEEADHVHHRSFWFTHGSVNSVDFWAEGPKCGKIAQKSLDAAISGPVMGIIRTSNDWIAPDGARVCSDTREMRIYNAKNGRLFDFITMISAPDGPVKFGDTKEGSFGFRVASTMRADSKKGGRILNARGEKDDATWSRQAEWCDCSGPVDGEIVGIAMMEHPGSFRAPTYWHVRTYGLFCANPFGLKEFTKDKNADGSYTIDKGKSITFSYRIWIHKGYADAAGVANVYKQYTNPPMIAVK